MILRWAGSHLRYWGNEARLLKERDWNQSVRISEALICRYVLPARHFSGRGIKRNQTLWGSFMFMLRLNRRFITAAIQVTGAF